MMDGRISSTALGETSAVAAAQTARAKTSYEAFRALSFAASGGVRQELSPREISVVDLIAHGQSNKEIARLLGITPETVKTHVKNIFLKLRVERRAQAVLRAHTIGLIDGSHPRARSFGGEVIPTGREGDQTAAQESAHAANITAATLLDYGPIPHLGV